MSTAICLLSGGMDSATALYWAAERYDNIVTINFDYGQRGAEHEWIRGCMIVDALRHDKSVPVSVIRHKLMIMADSALTVHDDTLDPGAKRTDGLPRTFVPGRNMIFIAHAAATAYELDADAIVGGWSSADVDYPDCSHGFIKSMGSAVHWALGKDIGVVAPLISVTKAETVRIGDLLGVPWELTRSCYDGGDEPCLKCDSCLVRMRAFVLADTRDPLVKDDKTWERIKKALLP